MLNTDKIKAAIKSGDPRDISKQINVTLETVSATMKLIETSFSTLNANRWHFSQKLVKISDKFRILRLLGAADKFDELSKAFDTKCPVQLEQLTEEYRDFVSPQYKLLEKTRDELKLLSSTLKVV